MINEQVILSQPTAYEEMIVIYSEKTKIPLTKNHLKNRIKTLASIYAMICLRIQIEFNDMLRVGDLRLRRKFRRNSWM